MIFEVLTSSALTQKCVELVGDIDHYTYQTFYSSNPWGEIDIVNWSIAKIMSVSEIYNYSTNGLFSVHLIDWVVRIQPEPWSG